MTPALLVTARGPAHQLYLEDTMDDTRRRARPGEAPAYLERMVAEGDREAGCWEWPFARGNREYGRVGSRLVHREAFAMAYGHMPEVCRHTCDNPPCFNPAHLLGGTSMDNTCDALERGLVPVGERQGLSRLTVERVRDMRRLAREGFPNPAIATQFSVSVETARSAILGLTWCHVDPTPEMDRHIEKQREIVERQRIRRRAARESNTV